MLATIFLAALPLAFQPSIQIAIGLILAFVVDILALVLFNRRGHILIAGLILTSMTELGILLTLVGQIAIYHNLHLGFVPFLALLIQGIAVASSTLNTRVSFMIFALNCAFLFLVVHFVPYSPDLVAYLHTPEGLEGLIETPLSCFVVGYVYNAIWVRSANNAIARADAADERANFIAKLAQQERDKLEREMQLAQDLNTYVMALMKIVANPQSMPSLPSNHSLLSLNTAAANVRARLLNLHQEATHTRLLNMKTQEALASLAQHLRENRPLYAWRSTGTSVDYLVSAFAAYEMKQKELPAATPKLEGFWRDDRSQHTL